MQSTQSIWQVYQTESLIVTQNFMRSKKARLLQRIKTLKQHNIVPKHVKTSKAYFYM